MSGNQLKILKINISDQDLDSDIIYQEILKKYNFLLNRKYSSLKEVDKRILYTYNLIKDGSPIIIALDCATTNTIDFIEDQLKEVFNYKDNIYIKG